MQGPQQIRGRRKREILAVKAVGDRAEQQPRICFARKKDRKVSGSEIAPGADLCRRLVPVYSENDGVLREGVPEKTFLKTRWFSRMN